MKCILDYDGGAEYEDRGKYATKEDTTQRKLPTFLFCDADEQRIIVISRECKWFDLEKKTFGNYAMLGEVPARYAL